MRSFLTSLGIIIGVSSVIVMVALGQGSTRKLIQHCFHGHKHDNDPRHGGAFSRGEYGRGQPQQAHLRRA
jgi:hypothetical protein